MFIIYLHTLLYMYFFSHVGYNKMEMFKKNFKLAPFLNKKIEELKNNFRVNFLIFLNPKETRK